MRSLTRPSIRLTVCALAAFFAVPLAIPRLSLAEPPAPHARVAPPVTGRVRNARRIDAAGQAVVNFGELARQQEQNGPPHGEARALVFPEVEEPLEPLSAQAPGAIESPSATQVASPSPNLTFMGLDDIAMVDSSYIIIPPDVDGAVGPAKIMSGLNNNYRIFNKADGSVVSTVGTATFWAPSGETALNGLTDPRTLYDPYNNRWIVEMQTVTTGAGDILVGVSQTSDPSGNWFLYRFAIGATIDFPIVGFNKNWISVSINRYSNAGLFQRGINLVLDYGQARAGVGTGTLFTQATNTHFCSGPCVTYSATEDTLFVLTHLSSGSATYSLDTITGTSAAPIYTSGGTLTRPGGGWAQPGGQLLPQSGPNSGASVCSPPCLIETQDAQMRTAPSYRGGFLYYTQTIGLPAAALAHTAAQWTKLTTAGAFIDGGRIEDATATSTNGGKWYAYPHIATNSVGDFIVGFSQFSSAQHPSSGYSVHLAGDAAGTLRDPLIYKPGEDYYHKDFGSGRNRWGDFSKAQVDPTDDRTLWVVNEYGKARVGTNDGTTGANSSRWSTYWASVGSAAPTVTIAPGPSLNEGNSGLTPFQFTVNLSSTSALPVTVNYHTSDGTATVANNDYQAANTFITIPAGSPSGVITVNVVGDTTVEPSETFTVVLTGATNGVLGSPSVSTGTILNDDTYTITASAGANGSISPSGAVSVAPGGSQAFTITPSSCYRVADVLVDGASVGPVTSFTFSAVAANHTIAASFALNTFAITASAGSGGTITPSGSVLVNCGANQAFSIVPDATHTIADVLVDGASVGAVATFTFTNVTAPHTISASFNLKVFTRANIPFSGVSPGGVDMASGELILVMRPDLRIDGPLPLTYGRYYGSMIAREGLAAGSHGTNWLGTYDWSLSVAGANATVVTNRGAAIRFTQGSGGSWNLASPTYAQFRLEPAGSSLRFTDPMARRSYLFDGTTGLLILVMDDSGNSLQIIRAGAQIAQVTDGLGRTLTFSYDGSGHINQVSDGTRSVIYSYTGGILTGVTNAATHTTTYSYAAPAAFPGLFQSASEPLGNTPVTYAYDGLGRVASHTDAFSHMSTYTYGTPSGNLYADPIGNTWTYQHDAQYRLTSLLDPASGTTSFTYDASGRLSSAQRPLLDATSFTYDPASGYVSQISLMGGASFGYGYGSHTAGGATFFDLTTASYPDATGETYNRDAAGNLSELIDRGGFHWFATYNARGQLLTATNPTTGNTTLTYDPQGRLATSQDNAGNTTHYGYDGLSRLTSLQWADGPSRAFAYDPLDHVTTFTDERLKPWTYAYDDDGRPQSATDPLLEGTQYMWDAGDRLAQVVDPLSHALVYGYDADGRVSSLTDRAGNVTIYGYDALSRLSGVTGPATGMTSIGYDADSRPTSVQDALGHAVAIGHDFQDRVTHVTDPLSNPFDFGYDAMERLLSVSAPLGHTEGFTYDSRGLLTRYLDVASQVDYGRTPLGEVSQVTDPNRNVWPEFHDPQGRPTSSSDPLTRTTSYSYDARNRLTHLTLPAGAADFAFDVATRNTGRTYSQDGTTIPYTYDDANRVTGTTGAAFAYDAAGRMTSSNGLSFTYDNDGRVLTETVAPGKVVTYSYDHGLLSQVADWVGGATAFSYDAIGRLTGITRPDGTAAAYQYDNANRVTQIHETHGSDELASMLLTRDALGRPSAIDRRQPLMPGATLPAASAFTYDPASQINVSTYDALGRMSGDASRSFQWDGASRLTHYAAGADSPSFTYDGYDRPLSKTLGAAAEQYVWNYALGAPTLDAVYQGATPRTFYVRAPSGLLLYAVDAATGARTFYHYDEAGNTAFLTNGSGSVVTEYAYTPFGGVSGLGLTSGNPFTWGSASGAMQLGSSGLFGIGGGVYDAQTMRSISGIAVNSGVSPGPIQSPADWVTKNPGPPGSPADWVMKDPGPIGSPADWVMKSPGPIQSPADWVTKDPGPAGSPVSTFKFGVVFTTKIDWSSPGDEGPGESVEMIFKTVKWQYQPQNPSTHQPWELSSLPMTRKKLQARFPTAADGPGSKAGGYDIWTPVFTPYEGPAVFDAESLYSVTARAQAPCPWCPQ